MSTPDKNVTHIKTGTDSELYIALDCDEKVKGLGFRIPDLTKEDTRAGVVISTLLTFALTGDEVNRIKMWVKEQLMINPNYVAHTLNETFCDNNNKKKTLWSTRPGKIRIFSRELMCYYDGKNWNKVKV